jgi:hypothetical protein
MHEQLSPSAKDSLRASLAIVWPQDDAVSYLRRLAAGVLLDMPYHSLSRDMLAVLMMLRSDKRRRQAYDSLADSTAGRFCILLDSDAHFVCRAAQGSKDANPLYVLHVPRLCDSTAAMASNEVPANSTRPIRAGLGSALVSGSGGQQAADSSVAAVAGAGTAAPGTVLLASSGSTSTPASSSMAAPALPSAAVKRSQNPRASQPLPSAATLAQLQQALQLLWPDPLSKEQRLQRLAAAALLLQVPGHTLTSSNLGELFNRDASDIWQPTRNTTAAAGAWKRPKIKTLLTQLDNQKLFTVQQLCKGENSVSLNMSKARMAAEAAVASAPVEQAAQPAVAQLLRMLQPAGASATAGGSSRTAAAASSAAASAAQQGSLPRFVTIQRQMLRTPAAAAPPLPAAAGTQQATASREMPASALPAAPQLAAAMRQQPPPPRPSAAMEGLLPAPAQQRAQQGEDAAALATADVHLVGGPDGYPSEEMMLHLLSCNELALDLETGSKGQIMLLQVRGCYCTAAVTDA